jgi:diguanylate cyclase (GGDEF)-like protein
VRKSDIVSRVGGDEFTVLLDTITPAQLEEKTASMRALFAELKIETGGPTLRIAVSVGSAMIESGTKAADVLDTADKSMYAHKRGKYPA